MKEGGASEPSSSLAARGTLSNAGQGPVPCHLILPWLFTASRGTKAFNLVLSSSSPAWPHLETGVCAT